MDNDEIIEKYTSLLAKGSRKERFNQMLSEARADALETNEIISMYYRGELFTKEVIKREREEERLACIKELEKIKARYETEKDHAIKECKDRHGEPDRAYEEDLDITLDSYNPLINLLDEAIAKLKETSNESK